MSYSSGLSGHLYSYAHTHTTENKSLNCVFVCTNTSSTFVVVMFLLDIYLEVELFIICIMFNSNFYMWLFQHASPTWESASGLGSLEHNDFIFSSALALTYQVGKMTWWIKAFAVCKLDHSLSWIPGTHSGNRDRLSKVVFWPTHVLEYRCINNEINSQKSISLPT